jgi:hypothetical protein
MDSPVKHTAAEILARLAADPHTHSALIITEQFQHIRPSSTLDPSGSQSCSCSTQSAKIAVSVQPCRNSGLLINS